MQCSHYSHYWWLFSIALSRCSSSYLLASILNRVWNWRKNLLDCNTVSYWHWSREVHPGSRNWSSQTTHCGVVALLCWQKGTYWKLLGGSGCLDLFLRVRNGSLGYGLHEPLLPWPLLWNFRFYARVERCVVERVLIKYTIFWLQERSHDLNWKKWIWTFHLLSCIILLNDCTVRHSASEI